MNLPCHVLGLPTSWGRPFPSPKAMKDWEPTAWLSVSAVEQGSSILTAPTQSFASAVAYALEQETPWNRYTYDDTFLSVIAFTDVMFTHPAALNTRICSIRSVGMISRYPLQSRKWDWSTWDRVFVMIIGEVGRTINQLHLGWRSGLVGLSRRLRRSYPVSYLRSALEVSLTPWIGSVSGHLIPLHISDWKSWCKIDWPMYPSPGLPPYLARLLPA